MGKKILSAVLVVVLAFLAGFGGGMLALQQSGRETTIKAFGQSIKIGASKDVPAKNNTAVTPAGDITIKVSEDITIAEAIAEKVMPSVVGISTTYESSYSSGLSLGDLFGGDIFGWGFGGGGGGTQKYNSTAVGTGVVVDKSGYILTNSHVINDGNYVKINVSFYDGTELEGTVLWNDSTLDLAVVKVEANNLRAAELGDSDTVKVGSYAAAIGNPLGLAFERSMSQGIISGLNRTITVSSDGRNGTVMENLMQTDATINSGNSGGPLLNAKGLVIGINSAKASSGEGMGFAIPINVAKPIVEQIKSTGKFERAYLGISGAGLSSQTGYSKDQLEDMFGTSEGIYVQNVTEGGGAAAAGLQKGDIILSIDGTEVGTMNKINTVLVAHKVGDVVKVEYMRDKETHSCKVTLTK